MDWNLALNIGGAILGLIGTTYALYEIFLQRVKIELYPANNISLAVSRKGFNSKFHLGCNLANKTSKLGAVQRLEVKVINPKNEVYRFRWKLFYEYQSGGQVRLSPTPKKGGLA